MASSTQIPSQHRALLLETIEAGFEVKSLPTPQPTHGSALIRIDQAGVLSYHREIYNGERHYDFPKPLVGGCSAIGRVAAVGPDAASLQPGQLVYVDCVIHGRDSPDDLFLTAISYGGTEGAKKLFREVWRNGAFAEFFLAPLENCIPLNETRLCRDLGYSTQDLMYIGYLMVGFGGLRDIKLEPGETIVVSPATGGFGGAGVQVAVAMGARVIAMGRNETELARLKAHVKKGTPTASIETVKITGVVKADTAALTAFGTIDAVLDLSPRAAIESTHLWSAISALRRNGRASLMGFVGSRFPADSWNFIGRNITLKGKLMYERDDLLQFVKMMEAGLFPRGKDFVDVRSFVMENWKEALDAGAEHAGIGKLVVISP